MDNDELKKKLAEGKYEFAPQDGIESFPEAFVDEFMRDILHVNGAWISDESSVWDFSPGRSHGARERILAKYGVDVGEEHNILKLLRLVYAVNRTPQ